MILISIQLCADLHVTKILTYEHLSLALTTWQWRVKVNTGFYIFVCKHYCGNANTEGVV